MSHFNRQLIYVNSYKRSQCALTGSILGAYLRDFEGYILGAGFISSRYNRSGNSWKVRIIRGPLSAEQCKIGVEKVLYADPGILASEIYRVPVKKEFELGIVPHSKDVPIFKNMDFGNKVKIIHLEGSLLQLLQI